MGAIFVCLFKLLMIIGITGITTLRRHKIEIRLVLLLMNWSARLGTRPARTVASTSINQRCICPGQRISGAITIFCATTNAASSSDERCGCSLSVVVNWCSTGNWRCQHGRVSIGIVGSKDCSGSQGFVRLKRFVSVVSGWIIAPIDGRLVLYIIVTVD